MSKLHSGSPRPYKVWSADRKTRKSITASNLDEFKTRGAEKLGFKDNLALRVVLESDGTEVEDDCYFQSAEKDTIFLLLRADENWLPPGIDALKSALSAIPQIVCDTISSMKLINKTPTWSIKDDQGFITVTLQWQHDAKSKYVSDYDEPSWKLSSSQPPTYAQYTDKVYSSTFPRPNSTRTKFESYLRSAKNLDLLEAYRTALPLKTLSADDFSFIDKVDDLSSAHDLTTYCDFHCSSLHREGGSIKVSKSVGTSPIPDRTVSPIITYSRTTSPFEPSHMLAQSETSVAQTPTHKTKKGHVRFMEVDKSADGSTSSQPNISLMGLINGHLVEEPSSNSDESETETTEREDEQICERYLLLVDQLSANQKKHLSIKDIGIILERLKSKIIDIDKLERDKENIGCYNWLLKATIRGEMLREIGVVYNGQYYGLMEHPGYF